MRRPKRDEVRRRLLDAAAAALLEGGVEAVSMERVAALAGFSKGAVYSNFESRDELLLGVLERHVATRIEELRRVIDTAAAADGIEAALEAGRQASDELAREPGWHQVLLELYLRSSRDPALARRFAEHRRAIRAPIAAEIERIAQRNGVTLRRPADQLAGIVLALFNGLAIEGLAETPAGGPSSALPLALSLLWAGATGQGPVED